MQIITVKQDPHDPKRVMLSVTEDTNVGHSVRIEKQYIPKLTAKLLKFAEPAIDERDPK